MSKVIIISSILKPVSDVRSYLRLALSLADHKSFEVHISGTSSFEKTEDARIAFHSLGKYSRSLITRLLFHLKTFGIFRKLRPSVIVITTFELIPIAIFYKVLYSTKLVYDIQENYEYNIRYQNVYPSYIKNISIWFIRFIQHRSTRFFELFLLAEKCYEKELKFLRVPYLILENKVPPHYQHQRPKKINEKQKFTFLFTGTLAEETGVYNAILWYQKLRSHFPDSQLVIVGFAAQPGFRKKIIRLSKHESGIVLITDDQPLKHDHILKWVVSADIGIVSYPISRANQHKIPTKVFEYSYYGLPILTHHNSHWYNVSSKLGTVISNELIDKEPKACSDMIKNVIATSTQIGTNDSLWDDEKQQIQNSIQTLINKL